MRTGESPAPTAATSAPARFEQLVTICCWYAGIAMLVLQRLPLSLFAVSVQPRVVPRSLTRWLLETPMTYSELAGKMGPGPLSYPNPATASTLTPGRLKEASLAGVFASSAEPHSLSITVAPRPAAIAWLVSRPSP